MNSSRITFRARVLRASTIVLLLLAAVSATGQPWEPERRVTSSTSIPDMTSAGNVRTVAIRRDTIHAVYHEGSSLDCRVYYARSTDAGATWSRTLLSFGGSLIHIAMFPALAFRNDTLHVTFLQYMESNNTFQIRYRRSTDAGNSWGSSVLISQVTEDLAELPAIALGGPAVHIVWDNGADVLYHRRSTDNGTTWENVWRALATNMPATASVAADGVGVVVSFSDSSGSNWDIWACRSINAGANFSSPVPIAVGTYRSDISSVALRGANATLVWYDDRSGNFDVRACRSTDTGRTWRDTVLVASGSSSQEAPSIVASPTNVLHVVYEDDVTGNYEIFHRSSTDGGVTWSSATQIDTATGVSQRPSISIAGPDTLGVLWTDHRYSSANPDVFFRRRVPTVVAHDVGPTRIVTPVGTLDSGSVVTPACSLYNWGTNTETYTVRLRIGTGYNYTASVTNHAPGTRAYATFPAWTANQRGTFGVVCTTELNGDQVPGNNRRIDSVFVRVLDVQPLAIFVPADTVDSGATVVPSVRIRNNGNTTVSSVITRMLLGGSYVQAVVVNGLGPGATRDTFFSPWTASPRGSQTKRCITDLSGDMVRTNDTLTGSVFVRVLDVQALALLAPRGIVDSSATVTPRVVWRNNSNLPVTCTLRLAVSGGYLNQQVRTNIMPGVTDTASFALWTATQPGPFYSSCTLRTAGDLVPANNVVTDSGFVRILDVECVALLAPTGTVDSGASVLPGATLRNNGNTTVTFDVRFTISDGYDDTRTVGSLGPGGTINFNFPPWTATRRGSFVTRCSTRLTGDMRPANDVKSGTVFVAVHDCGVTDIISPAGAVPPGPVTPRAQVRNFGNLREPVRVFFTINSAPAYRDSLTITNGLPESDTVLSFLTWNGLPGDYLARCSVFLANDMQRVNDTMNSLFTVRNVDVACRRIAAPLGRIDSSATVVPQALVENLGAGSATFRTWFRIFGSTGMVYSDS
ncbi:MAG: exo-alpha-sialidase, partial [candidate division WOR-3 bacterium]